MRSSRSSMQSMHTLRPNNSSSKVKLHSNQHPQHPQHLQHTLTKKPIPMHMGKTGKKCQTSQTNHIKPQRGSYPQPEQILKQIERNIDVLKVMYEMSLERYGHSAKDRKGKNSKEVNFKKKKSQQTQRSTLAQSHPKQPNFDAHRYHSTRPSTPNIASVSNNTPNTNITSLYQIFNFYKRSIGSSVLQHSHQQQQLQVSSEKSLMKDTPSNSMVKKNGKEESGRGGVEEVNCKNQSRNRSKNQSRNVSRDGSMKKLGHIDRSAYDSKQARNMNKSKSSKTQHKNICKITHNNGYKSSTSQQKQLQSSQSAERNPQHRPNLKSKPNKTSPFCLYSPQPHQPFDFPPIHNSTFSKDMPILQQDSREQVSSSALLTAQRIKCQQFHLTNEAECKMDSLDSQTKDTRYQVPQRQNNDRRQWEKYNQQAMMRLIKKRQGQFLLYGSMKRQGRQAHRGGSQNKRFPTPSFAVSEAETEQKLWQQVPRNSEEKYVNRNAQNSSLPQRNISEGSLAGCQIVKQGSDSLDFDKFELVSFEF